MTEFDYLASRCLFSETYCGGYSGEDPPLPIPNREVKLTIADGTAPPGGRVGSCHFLLQAFETMSRRLFLCVSVIGGPTPVGFADSPEGSGVFPPLRMVRETSGFPGWDSEIAYVVREISGFSGQVSQNGHFIRDILIISGWVSQIAYVVRETSGFPGWVSEIQHCVRETSGFPGWVSEIQHCVRKISGFSGWDSEIQHCIRDILIISGWVNEIQHCVREINGFPGQWIWFRGRCVMQLKDTCFTSSPAMRYDRDSVPLWRDF